MLSLLKGGLNKQARDSLGRAIANHVNALVTPKFGGHAIKLDARWAAVVNNLRALGFSMIDDVFSASAISRIFEFVQDKSVSYGLDHDYDKVSKRTEGPLAEAPAQTRFANYKKSDLLACPEIYQVVHNQNLLGTATAYLGAPPTISSVSMWWSLPVHRAAGPQEYHHDRGDFRSVNLFVYLTDVGEKNGPHAFVQQTHELEILHPLASKLYGADPKKLREFWLWLEGHRKTDEEVARYFPAEMLKSFTGPQGTSFLEDTRGQHKGTAPTDGRRLVFEIVYSTLPKYSEEFAPIERGALGLPAEIVTDVTNIHPLARYATRLMYS